jgi:hypothetical protein
LYLIYLPFYRVSHRRLTRFNFFAAYDTLVFCHLSRFWTCLPKTPPFIHILRLRLTPLITNIHKLWKCIGQGKTHNLLNLGLMSHFYSHSIVDNPVLDGRLELSKLWVHLWEASTFWSRSIVYDTKSQRD